MYGGVGGRSAHLQRSTVTSSVTAGQEGVAEASVSWQSTGGQCTPSIMNDWCAVEILTEERALFGWQKLLEWIF